MPDGYTYIGLFKDNKFVQKISLKSNNSSNLQSLAVSNQASFDYGRAWLLNNKS